MPARVCEGAPLSLGRFLGRRPWGLWVTNSPSRPVELRRLVVWNESARRGDQGKEDPPVNQDCGVAATSCRELNRQISCVAGETTDQPAMTIVTRPFSRRIQDFCSSPARSRSNLTVKWCSHGNTTDLENCGENVKYTRAENSSGPSSDGATIPTCPESKCLEALEGLYGQQNAHAPLFRGRADKVFEGS